MKKTICLISVVIFLFGCASTPKNKTPVDESIVKLHRAKEIQCDFTKGVAISLTEQGELEVEQLEPNEDDEDDMRLLFKIDPKSNNATIYDAVNPYILTSKVRRTSYGISFIVDIEDSAIATFTVFRADDVSSGYVAALSISGELWGDALTWVLLGSCKVIE